MANRRSMMSMMCMRMCRMCKLCYGMLSEIPQAAG